MASADVILRFEPIEGETPDATKVIRALSAYVEILRTAGSIVEPGHETEIGLAGVEDGSDVFKFVIRGCESFAENLKEGMAEYPLTSKAAISLGGLISGTVLVVGITNALTPDPRIPEDQMEVFRKNNELLEESLELKRREMEFYGILMEEPAYKSFDVIRPHDGFVIRTVPREEFAARSGLWGEQELIEQEAQAQTRTATWDVVLIKPTLVPQPRRWRFARDGIEFSALMNDKDFLAAIHDKTLPVKLAEGIRMKVELKYREIKEEGGWTPVLGSHRIVRVLDPLPPPTTVAPLFPDTSPPKE